MSCQLVEIGQPATPFQVTAAPQCTKSGGQWQCTPAASFSGLGPLDAILSTFVNQDAGIAAALKHAVDPSAP